MLCEKKMCEKIHNYYANNELKYISKITTSRYNSLINTRAAFYIMTFDNPRVAIWQLTVLS